MAHSRPAAFMLASLLAAGVALGSDPPYDRQTKTYNAQFSRKHSSSQGTYTPFFSPEHSSDTLVGLIESAQHTIDIATPGFDSWEDCTYGTPCAGCTIDKMAKEPFPIFPAILNAVHRGVKVRVVTNKVFQTTCQGKIQPLDWWSLNGIEIQVYTTTTFMHGKYMSVDGKKTSVSSINYSHTSFTENREAGMVVEEQTYVDMYAKVFEYDFQNGYKYTVNQTYSPSQMATITSKATLPVVLPTITPPKGGYVTPKPTPIAGAFTGASWVAPDYSTANLMEDLGTVKENFEIMIYQITDTALCSQLETMADNGVNVTVLVSDHIYSTPAWKTAQECYKKLYYKGVDLWKTNPGYKFSHQKFWIIDGYKITLDTGNWSPSDFPEGNTFPPYSSSSWQDTNRDYIITVHSKQVAGVYANVIYQDRIRGFKYYPN